VHVAVFEVPNSEALPAAFDGAAQQRAGGIVVVPSPVTNSARVGIAELAARHRMPAIMAFSGFVRQGGLIAYGPGPAGALHAEHRSQDREVARAHFPHRFCFAMTTSSTDGLSSGVVPNAASRRWVWDSGMVASRRASLYDLPRPGGTPQP
jgi:hypothetical protein